MFQESGIATGVDLPTREFRNRFAETDGAVLLDVRTPAEFEMGHIPDAVNLDISAARFAADIAGLDRAGHYFVYCRSGSRSATACGYMQQLGFSHVYNLAFGIIDWDGEIE
jgi:rhodanese-related sulfurtransferase